VSERVGAGHGKADDAAARGTVDGLHISRQPRMQSVQRRGRDGWNMYKLYMQFEGSGIVQKVEGKVYANTATGQLTATFLENPQFPLQSRTAGPVQGRAARGIGDTAELRHVHEHFGSDAVEHPVHARRDPASSFDVSWDGTAARARPFLR